MQKLSIICMDEVGAVIIATEAPLPARYRPPLVPPAFTPPHLHLLQSYCLRPRDIQWQEDRSHRSSGGWWECSAPELGGRARLGYERGVNSPLSTPCPPPDPQRCDLERVGHLEATVAHHHRSRLWINHAAYLLLRGVGGATTLNQIYYER